MQRFFSSSSVVVMFLVLFVALACAQQSWEDKFLEIPSSARSYEYLAYLTSAPHPAGTPENRDTAYYVFQKFMDFGLQARIEPEEVLLSYPRNFNKSSRLLQVVSPTPYTAGLQEPVIPVDPTSGDDRVVPTFHGYGASGDVTAQVVYVHYGRVEDYNTLDSLGISVRGKIVIARYGEIFRGLIVWLAQLRGAVGCIIYSDPAEDGFVRGKTYPDGPWRPQYGVQRGSVQFISLCPGDPRNPLCNGNWTDHVPSIPSLPISWGDAEPILKQLGGPTIKDWQGGLPITYKVGPGPVVVHMKLDMDFRVHTILNVIADIPGDIADTVILGNHRDAWTFGATDPNSGTSALLEVARAYGQLVRQGWKPSRSIRICSWDGEEFGLLGSTAYADRHADWVTQRAVAYLNVDVAVTGPSFDAGGTHSLNTLLWQVADKITDPNSGKPLSSVWDGSIDTLGSGSDYTSFMDRYGVASVSLGFTGPYGVYHSTYDSMNWMKSFGDPVFAYHRAMAQYWGVLGMRLADDNLLPFNYSEEAIALQDYFTNADDLLKQYNGTGKVDLSSVSTAIQDFTAAAKKLEKFMKTLQKMSHVTAEQSKLLALANEQLFLVEREFLGPGIPQRPYFRHVIQAPGLYAGYGTEVFPGVEQEILDQNWANTQEQASVLATRIQAATTALKNILNLSKNLGISLELND